MVPPVRRRFSRRRIRVFGIGAPKSGTHSLAAVFEGRYRTAHEPEDHTLARLIVDLTDGRADETELVRYLEDRERRLRLEVNSAGLNGLVVDHLVDVVPSAKFILTIREPTSWLNSLVNHSVERSAPPVYLRMREQRFASEQPHPPEEQPLADRGLYTVEGYLRSWTERHEQALDAVPPERLLVVRLDQLGERLGDIASFVGVKASSLDGSRAHQFPAPTDHGVLDDLPEGYVAEKVATCCGPLVERFFR